MRNRSIVVQCGYFFMHIFLYKTVEKREVKGNLCYQTFFLAICQFFTYFSQSYHKIHCDMVVNSSRGCSTQGKISILALYLYKEHDITQYVVLSGKLVSVCCI